MTNEPDELRVKQPRGSFVVVVIVLFILLPFLYVLSVGPAVGLRSYGLLSLDWYYRIYGPLLYACQQWPLLGSFADWWVELFPYRRQELTQAVGCVLEIAGVVAH